MNMYDIILKKRHGSELTDDEIRYFINGYTSAEIPDYQVSALCMAICCMGMSDREAASMTYYMMYSGDTVDLSMLNHTVDKHSTGGVGDKTTLIVAPTAASVGCTVAKMSGRGLGHTGGTMDKLESIPGYQTEISANAFMEQVKKIGIAVVGQTGNLAPADKKLYALRDVTATVDSIPLISSSIMSKKLAAGAKSIVLDVKYGSGAFMKTLEEAVRLAETMVYIGKANGRRMCAVITDMDVPLGQNIGNSLEVMEALQVLRGEKRGSLYEVCLTLAANMASLALTLPYDAAHSLVQDAIDSGKAYDKFLEWIAAQGGDISYIEKNTLPVGKHSRKIKAARDGYITHMNAEEIGRAACLLGAGRRTKDDVPDLSAGIILECEIGKCIKCGNTLCTLYTSDKTKLADAENKIKSAIEIGESEPKQHPLIYKILK